MKIDPYKHKERWLHWKDKVKKGIPNLNEYNSDIIRKYLSDMELGINVSSVNKKGSRSYIRLNTLRDKLCFFAKKFKEIYKVDKITEIEEEQVLSFFSSMRNGELKREDGKLYKSTQDFAKVFKAFWHWYQKTNRKQGKTILDITIDLDTTGTKPEWVYLTEEQVKTLCNNAKYEYKVLMMFLFDSGIRSPTELINIKVSDLYNDCKELFIRDEISKTFGRKLKLMICSQLLKEYIKEKHLTSEDYLFKIIPIVVNRYLRRLAQKVFGNEKSLAGQRYSELTMYDFRHISCCYWLPRYKSESALKYRFGWKKSEKIHYYSELLGMKDTIAEEDMLIDVTKTEIEKRLEKSEKEKEIMQDKMKAMEEEIKGLLDTSKKIWEIVELRNLNEIKGVREGIERTTKRD